MSEFSLAPYTIRVRKKHDTSHPYRLDSLPGGVVFADVVHNNLRRLINNYVPEKDSSKILRLSRLETDLLSLSGIVQSGKAGIQAELYDTDARDVAFTRETNHAEMYPFYFLFHFPQATDFGVAIFQRYHNLGIQSAISILLHEWVRGVCPDCVLEMNTLGETSLLRQYMDRGRMTKIRAIKHVQSTDPATDLARGYGEEVGTISLNYEAKRKGRLPLGRLNQFLGGQRRLNQLVELGGFEYDTVKAEFEVDGSKRTINLQRLDEIRPVIDITDDIVRGPNNFPTYESVNKIAGEHLTRMISASQT